MSIRIRKDGTMLCAAKSEPMEGDRYIDDTLHYFLSVDLNVLHTDDDPESGEPEHWYFETKGKVFNVGDAPPYY